MFALRAPARDVYFLRAHCLYMEIKSRGHLPACSGSAEHSTSHIFVHETKSLRAGPVAAGNAVRMPGRMSLLWLSSWMCLFSPQPCLMTELFLAKLRPWVAGSEYMNHSVLSCLFFFHQVCITFFFKTFFFSFLVIHAYGGLVNI